LNCGRMDLKRAIRSPSPAIDETMAARPNCPNRAFSKVARCAADRTAEPAGVFRTPCHARRPQSAAAPPRSQALTPMNSPFVIEQARRSNAGHQQASSRRRASSWSTSVSARTGAKGGGTGAVVCREWIAG
jgi:hypothetical protein